MFVVAGLPSEHDLASRYLMAASDILKNDNSSEILFSCLAKKISKRGKAPTRAFLFTDKSVYKFDHKDNFRSEARLFWENLSKTTAGQKYLAFFLAKSSVLKIQCVMTGTPSNKNALNSVFNDYFYNDIPVIAIVSRPRC